MCAAALFDGTDGTLLWCNERYLALLDPPMRREDIIGVTLASFDPVFDAAHPGLVQSVSRSGRMRAAEDRLFSVEDGDTIYRWAFHPLPNEQVLLLLESWSVR